MTRPSSNNREDPEFQIVLHLGAHKTATTYLQSRLGRSAELLRENGVCYVRVGELREAVLSVRDRTSLPNRIAAVRNWRTAGVYRRYLREAEDAECRRLVISEENLLGSLAVLVKTGFFYHAIQKRLEPVFKGLNGRPVTALLAVRSYDTFMASVWSQLIRNEGYCKIDEEIKARLLAVPRGWVEVIQDIISALPAGSQLRLWRYEDFIKDDTEVISALVGAENCNHVAQIAQHMLPRLSVRAMKRLDELSRNGMPTGPENVKRVGKRFSKEKGFKPYSPWTDEQIGILSKRYEEDIARIRSRWPGMMM
jgi:hypothetical protein